MPKIKENIMMVYKDRAYCATEDNKCTHTECTRHQKTTNERFTLKNNTENLPLSITDFSEDCEDYRINWNA